jgi:hypothetical protein
MENNIQNTDTQTETVDRLAAFRGSDTAPDTKTEVAADGDKPDTASKPDAAVEDKARFQRQAIETAKIAKRLREREQELEKHKAQISEFDKIKSRLAARDVDPLEQAQILESLGFDLSEYAERRLKGGIPAKTKEQAEIEEMRQKLEAIERDKAEKTKTAQQAQEQQQIQLAYDNGAKWLDTNKEKYPLISALGLSKEFVHEVMRRDQEGLPFTSLDEPAAEIENAVKARVVDNIQSLSKLGLLDTLLKEIGATVETKKPERKTGTKTLTNSQAAAVNQPVDYSQLSSDEIRDRAIAKAFGARQ